MKKRKKALLVLGMHRSGTSSVAGVLCKLGGTAPRTLYGAFASNPKGHWESEAIFRLNDRILESFGSSWADWRAILHPFADSQQDEAFRAEAVQTFKSEYGDGVLPVLKDPRICRLMPFWTHVLHALKIDVHIVTPLRPPLDTARSLEARDGTPIVIGVHIWLRHVLEAEFASRGMPRTIFTWADFLEDWRKTAARIAENAEIDWPIPLEGVADDIDEFLTKDLRHHASAFEHHPHVHAWATDVYDAMVGLSAGERPELHTQLDRIRNAMDETSDLLGYFAADYAQINKLKSQISDLESLFDSQKNTLNNYKNLSEQYKGEIIQHWHKQEFIEKQKEEISQKATRLEDNIKAYKLSIENYKNLTDQYKSEIEQHWIARGALEGDKARLSQSEANLIEIIKNYEISLENYKNLTDQYKYEIEKHWIARGDLENDKSRLSQREIHLAESVKKHESEIDTHRSARIELEAEKEKLSQTVINLETIIENNDASLREHRELAETYAGEIRRHWTARSSLEIELADQSMHHSGILEAHAASLSAVQSLMETQKEEIAAQRSAKRQMEIEKQQLASTIRETQAQVAQLLGGIEKSDAENRALSSELNAAQTRSDQLETEKAELHATLQELQLLLDRPIMRLARRMHR